jgi:hypothetical protein
MVASADGENDMNAMKTWGLTIALAAAAACAPAAFAAGDAHSHDEAGAAKLALDHGRKWDTDGPLRDGMGRIRTLAADGVAKAHAGKMTPAQYTELARKVELEVAGIVTNCKLEPQADAMLHLVLAGIGEGTDAMAGKGRLTPEQGLVRVAGAANDYGRFFDHPGYQPIPLAH